MATPTRFTCFANLPPELRFQVWTLALTAGAVWAANSVPAKHRPDSMAFVGPSPRLAGLACKEAWRLMEQIYDRPVKGLSRCGEGTWVGLDHTVIALGPSQDTVALLDRFSADDLSRFQHVAVQWRTWASLVRNCIRLAQSCPALRTLIIQRIEPDAQARPLAVERAAFYAALLQYEESHFGDSTIDSTYLHQSLVSYFVDSLPMIHLVS